MRGLCRRIIIDHNRLECDSSGGGHSENHGRPWPCEREGAHEVGGIQFSECHPPEGVMLNNKEADLVGQLLKIRQK